MLKNMTRPERCVDISYAYDYDYGNGSGFSFPCDARGHIYKDQLSMAALDNLEFCKENTHVFEWYGVRTVKSVYTKPATGECSCGNLVELWNQYHGACQCERCGRWHNLFGQELIPPEYLEDDDDDENYYDDF